MELVQSELPKGHGIVVIGDIEPFVSPVDGTLITTRPHMLEHMRRHGVTHVSDFNAPGGHWDRKRQERADYLAGKTNPHSRQRIEHLKRAFEVHQARRRK